MLNILFLPISAFAAPFNIQHAGAFCIGLGGLVSKFKSPIRPSTNLPPYPSNPVDPLPLFVGPIMQTREFLPVDPGKKLWIPQIPLKNVVKFSRNILDFMHENPEFQNGRSKAFTLESSKITIPNYGFLNIDRSNRIIIIGLRGTQAIEDWSSVNLINSDSLWSKPTPFKIECHVHKGFKDLADKLHPQISQHLKKEFGKNLKELLKYKFYFTGYSLGGAVAQISALNLYYDLDYPFVDHWGPFNNKNQFKDVSFSAPKVFVENRDKEVSYLLGNENLLRIQLSGDKIPSYPFFGFKHVGSSIDVPIDKDLYDSQMLPRLKGLGVLEIVPQTKLYHSLDVLQKHLEKWLKEL